MACVIGSDEMAEPQVVFLHFGNVTGVGEGKGTVKNIGLGGRGMIGSTSAPLPLPFPALPVGALPVGANIAGNVGGTVGGNVNTVGGKVCGSMITGKVGGRVGGRVGGIVGGVVGAGRGMRWQKRM